MPSRVENMVTALMDEFSEDVAFAAAPPNEFRANSVVVIPNPEDWLVPAQAGARPEDVKVRERWDVLCVASMRDQAQGIAVMRGLALRSMRALSRVGAVWAGSTIEAVSGDDNKALVAAVNVFTFTYQANEHLPTPSP